jgi:hypothetical protein
MQQPRHFLRLVLLLLTSSCSAQIFPAYTLNVCDTNSTGYYFLAPLKIGQGVNPTQLILDARGNVIYSHEFTTSAGDFKLQPDGLMSYGYQNAFYFMDSTFTVVDSVTCVNGILHDGHDMRVLPNGNFLLMGYENVQMNLSGYNLFGPNNNIPGSTNATVKCGVIQEQDANGNVVFEWHSKDYYAFDDVGVEWLGNPNNVDWTHFNAMELDADGNILISVRHFNEITKISRADSSIIWRMGGNENQFAFTNDPQQFKGQHDIRRIANGNLTLLDNGSAGSPFHPVAGKEYAVDETLMTVTLVWSYTENSSVSSLAIGNMQRTANGNSLINYGLTPGQTLMFNVVDPTGTKIFEIEFADTLRTYRAFNYTTLPWQLPRPQITCFFNGSQYFLDAGSGHASYLWSTGATTQTIPVTVADTFSVFVPVGQGGFIRSEYFIVGDAQNPCWGALSVEPDETGAFVFFPNPANEELTIRFSPGKENSVVAIVDLSGRKVRTVERNGASEVRIPVTDLAPGMYFVQCGNVTGRFVKR